ncbi:MAG: transporter, family, multidrug resistance protein [Solirubrobacteraceae bacterium]|nr:transporter, family, multidrug resistance protein [Solirubrobacteraceae bacterium]
MPQRRLIVLLGSIVAIGPLSIDTYLPAFPTMSRALDASASSVQLTLTACLAGIGIGQLVAGSLSDRLGRRRPILVGLFAYVIASLLCAIAPDVLTLTALRFVQGFSAAAGLVIAQAVVRDLHSGAAAVRLFSSLMLIIGVAPILAPVLGGQLLELSSWRGIFVALAVIGALVGIAVLTSLPETLPPERRDRRGLRQTFRTLGGLLRQRDFMGYAIASSLSFATVFAYVSGSSFVLQDIYGLSPTVYSIVFGFNGIGLIVASQVNARLVGRVESVVLLRRALLTSALASLALLAVISIDGLGAWSVMVPLFVLVSSFAFVLPNATALALADHPEVAGVASALLGVIQFASGAAVAPLVGIAGTDTAVPMGVVMSVLGIAGIAAMRILVPARVPGGAS